MATDAASAMLDVMAERGEELPTEAPGAIVASVAVSAPVSAAASSNGTR